MQGHDWSSERERIVQILKSRSGNEKTCSEVIDDYEQILRSIWDFTARRLGDAGARSVLARSIRVAAQESPLLQTVQPMEQGADLGEFREHTERLGCRSAEVMDALLRLGVVIFETLSELAGEALTKGLLRRLEED